MTTANLPVTQLTGIGFQTANRLEKLGIRTIQDLLFHLPHLENQALEPIKALEEMRGHGYEKGDALAGFGVNGVKRFNKYCLVDRIGATSPFPPS